MTTLEKLQKFAYQRSGIDANNYFSDYRDANGIRAFRGECREITKDLHDFQELLYLAGRRIDNLEEKLTAYLSKNSGRLTLENGKLQYITGLHFPTEYRPAACFVVASLLWADFREEASPDGTPLYKDAISIRKAAARELSRRVCKNYFN